MGQHGRNIQTQRLQLLEQAKDERGSCTGEASDAARALASAVALLDHHDLVDVSQRRGHGSENPRRSLQDAGQLLEDRLEPGGVVELFPGFGLLQDGLRFGHALRLNGARLRQSHRLNLRCLGAPFGFDRSRAAQAFLSEFLLLRFRQRDLRGLTALGFEDGGLLGGLGAQDGGLALGFGGLDDGGLQFLLLALDLLFLDGNLFLRAHPFDAHFLDHHRLLGLGVREGPGLGGRGLLRLDLGQELRLLHLKVALRRRNVGIRVELGFLSFLHGLGRPDLGVPRRLGFANRPVTLHLRRALLAQRVEVAFLIADLLHGEHVHADAHALQVLGGFRRQLLGETLAVAIDFLDGQRAQDGSKVTLQGLKDDFLDLVGRHAEETLGRGAQGDIVTLDFDVGDRFDEDRNALQGVSPFDLERNGEHIEREVVDLFQQGEAKGRPTVDHPIAYLLAVCRLPLAATQDGHSVRRNLDIVPAKQRHGYNEG